MRLPSFRFLVISVLAAALTLAAGACGGGGSSTGGVSPKDVLAGAATRFEAVKTFHFKLEHEKGSTDIVLGLSLTTAEGDFALPDRMSAEAQAKAGPTTVRVKVVGIGDRTWITNPFTREFQRAPGSASILDIINPAEIVRAVARDMTGATIAGGGSVDGVDCYEVRGTISSDALADALSFADSGRTLEVQAWIGKGDSLLRRARLKGPLLPEEPKDIARVITLSKFDAAVTIDEPR